MAKGKGIVTQTPTVTTPKGTVIAVYTDSGSGVLRNAELLFDNNPAVTLAPGDAIEFNIIDPRNCAVIRKLAGPKGIVINTQLSMVRVTDPNPNDFGVQVNQTLSYSYLPPPIPYVPVVNDIIQFIVIDNVGGGRCVVVKKISP